MDINVAHSHNLLLYNEKMDNTSLAGVRIVSHPRVVFVNFGKTSFVQEREAEEINFETNIKGLRVA